VGFLRQSKPTLAELSVSRLLDGIAPDKDDAPDKQGFEAWVKSHWPTYVWNAAQHRAIFEALRGLDNDDYDQLMIFMPPRHSKSETVTIRASAYKAIMESDRYREILIAAYNLSLATKFTRAIRNICWREGVLAPDQRAAGEFRTTDGVIVRAAGVQSGIAGKGGDWIVIDDPIRNREDADSSVMREKTWDWYNDDLLTRRGPNAKLVLIQTRWHLDDLAGRILDSEDAPNWKVLHLPAIALDNDPAGREPGEALWPERFPVERLRRTEIDNPRGFMALYQGMPQPAGGAVYLAEWWKGKNRYDPTERWEPVGRVIFWDTAEEDSDSADYTAGVVLDLMPDYTVRVVDVIRKRVLYPDLLNLIVETAIKHNHDGKLQVVDIEYASSGRQAYQTLDAQAPDWLQRILYRKSPKGAKPMRARGVASWCKYGMVKLPYPHESVPWLRDFEREIFDFPTAAHDDQVDALSGALTELGQELEHGFEQRINEGQVVL